ncbi:MAG: tetratricopeptide repeat protein [Bacteroidota bacterium]
MHDDYLIIDQYLNGELQGHELKAFEARLAREEDLAQEVKLQKAMAQAVIEYDRLAFQDKLSEMEKKMAGQQPDDRKQRKGLYIFLGILTLVVLVALIMNIPVFQKQDKPSSEVQNELPIDSTKVDPSSTTPEKNTSGKEDPPIATDKTTEPGTPEKEPPPVNDKQVPESRPLELAVNQYLAVVEPLDGSTRGQEDQDKWKAYFEKGEYREAANLLDQLIDSGEGNDEIHFFAGQCHLQLKIYDEAIILFGKAIGTEEVEGGYYDGQSLWLRSLAHFKKGNLEKAKADWRTLASDDYYTFRKAEAKALLEQE